ncbi:MAG TPA: DNA recombination protein RmuC [Candidatus Omnitrophota bacterium]|nr:DNA recombination protein RmuC [Candidatus Omnitrophota bacterium]HPS37626.1 DNA recombination protein RmuC [Candidatus Omnitrophota bacterium]
MSIFFTAFIGVLAAVVVLATVAWFVLKLSRRPAEDKTFQPFLQLQQELHNLHTTLQDQIQSLSGQMNDQMKQNARFLQENQQSYRQVMGDVQHRLGVLQQATQSMMDIGKDISSLHDILRAPKLRGGMGEFLLAELLRQILPEDHFSLQYRFRNGSQVDAIIRLGDGLISVDAKFPLENFKRLLEAGSDEKQAEARKVFLKDVKKHIDDISVRYILPEEGTFEFALMYIPSESVYYEIIIKDDSPAESLSSYAMKKKVIPVSPNSFYAYLQAIVRGLKGMRIERSAQIILESLGQLEVDLEQCVTDFEKIGGHLMHARSAYEKTEQRFHKVQNRLSALEQHQGQVAAPVAKEIGQEPGV